MCRKAHEPRTHDPVDGKNPANQLIPRIYHYIQGFIYLRWYRISFIINMSFKRQYCIFFWRILMFWFLGVLQLLDQNLVRYSHVMFHNIQLQQKMGEFKPLSKKIALQSHPMSKILNLTEFFLAVTAVENPLLKRDIFYISHARLCFTAFWSPGDLCFPTSCSSSRKVQFDFQFWMVQFQTFPGRQGQRSRDQLWRISSLATQLPVDFDDDGDGDDVGRFHPWTYILCKRFQSANCTTYAYRWLPDQSMVDLPLKWGIIRSCGTRWL